VRGWRRLSESLDQSNDPNIILLVSDQAPRNCEWRSHLEFLVQTSRRPDLSRRSDHYLSVLGLWRQQESGSVCIASRGNDGAITYREWHPVGAIEYGYVTPDPLDPDIIYGGGRSEVSKFHWFTGQVQNITPIRCAPRNTEPTAPTLAVLAPRPARSIFRQQRALQTTNGGNSWQTISSDLTRENPAFRLA